MTTTAADSHFMRAALALAHSARQRARPNPTVGCVIVNDGRIVGRGVSELYGGAHAEQVAISEAGAATKGSSVFVTLEPCAHEGQTPPCVDALIRAEVNRVCLSLKDTNPLVNGAGIERLRAAGIEVVSGVLESEAKLLHSGFLSRMQRARPWVVVKVATSLDGATAMASGESQWITSPTSRRTVHELRASAGAVMVGGGTVRADNPNLTARLEDAVLVQPRAVVLDSELRCDPSAVVMQRRDTLVFCAAGRNRNSHHGAAEVIAVDADSKSGGLDLAQVLHELAHRGINDVLVEAGPTLSGALVSGGFADEYQIFVAPRWLGSQTGRMLETPGWNKLADGQSLDIVEINKNTDGDLVIRAYPKLETS